MKVSYNWLNTKYFDEKLPSPEEVAEKLTFHAWEIEEIMKVGNDTVLDVKVLPDKAMWALSHRGIAKDISVILNLPLKADPLLVSPELTPVSSELEIELESPMCRRFAAAHVKNIKVGPSPQWLRSALEAIGQRSINNIVDASNYVMFDLGQPSHAFDADVIGTGLLVRQAEAGETLSALDEKEYTFTKDDTVIAAAGDKHALSIAGIKGGKESGISEKTTSVIVEVANWDPVLVRKTANRLKLRSDASSRYENGLVPEMVPYGLKAVVDLILEVAGGEVVGYKEVVGDTTAKATASVTLSKLNSVLGLTLSETEVISILDRFGWKYEVNGDEFVVTPPFERTDLVIAEDLIEEIGRIHGYTHVKAITPSPVPVTEINQRFYYSEKIREILLDKGFSEVYTSSFRSEDEVKLANAFAADKGYLRGSLLLNLKEALSKNAPNADVLGIRQVKIFEIGTVFGQSGEKLMVGLGVQSPSGFKAKVDEPVLKDAITALNTELGMDIKIEIMDGVSEFNFGEVLEKLPAVSIQPTFTKSDDVSYKPFSLYPSMSRDIAMWVPETVSREDIEQLLREKAGDLCVRVTLFDEFKKDDRVSYAYRLVFQSKEKTLEGSEVNAVMDGIYQAVAERGYETR